jgi:hypothetical protein
MPPELPAICGEEVWRKNSYSNLINIIRYAVVTMSHTDTNDFGLFSEEEKIQWNNFKIMLSMIPVFGVFVLSRSIPSERSAEI